MRVSRLVVSIGVVVIASLGAAGLYAHARAAPACDSEQALQRVADILREQFHLSGIFVNGIRGVSGGPFSARRQCSAQVTEIRGNVSASDLPWRDLRYSIASGATAEHPGINVTLGNSVAFDGSRPSLWRNLLGLF